MCPGHEANGEFAGESGNLYREWWQTENLRFSLILQIVENQRSKQGNKKAERGVRPAKRQKNGGKDQDRTGDTRIFSPLLYQLSYPATLFIAIELTSITAYNIHVFLYLSTSFSTFLAIFFKKLLLRSFH